MKQSKMGLELKNEVSSIFNSYRSNDRPNEKQFTENVMMAVEKSLRNLGLARDAHVSYLDYKAREYEEEKNYLNEVSSFSSFSSKGLIPKIITFLGGGAGLPVAVQTISSLMGNGSTIDVDNAVTKDTEAITAISKVLEVDGLPENSITHLTGIVDKLSSNMIALMDNTEGASETLYNELPLEYIIFAFIASGIAVMAVSTIISKIWKKRHLETKFYSMQNEYKIDWQNKIRPSMADCLFDLYKDLRFTMNRFYPNYEENGFITTSDLVGSSCDDETARKIINEEIIQPASVERLFYIPVKAEPGQEEEEEEEEDQKENDQKENDQKENDQKENDQKENDQKENNDDPDA